MKTKIAILVVISFFAIVTIAAISQQHDHSDHSNNCFAAAATQQADCTSQDGIASIIYHMKAFRSFSAATFLSLIILAIVSVATFLHLFGRLLWHWPIPKINIQKKFRMFAESFEEHTRNWLATIQKRDPSEVL